MDQNEGHLTLILVDSELERTPRKLWGDPIIGKYARQREKLPEEIILDDTYHHGALRKLPDGWRRGRPDIVHFFLNVAQDSILNKLGLLSVYVHTRNNEVIYVRPETRIVKHYMRFIGLMEALFKRKCIPSEEEPLIVLYEDMPINELLEKISPDYTILLSEKGKKRDLVSLFKEHLTEHVAVMIGGFPKGDFLSPVYDICDENVCLFEESLTAWVSTYETIVRYEVAKGII